MLPERFSPYRISAKPNRAARRKASRAQGAVTALILALLTSTALPRPAQALTVFDPLNYEQNLLSTVRALEQINNQIRQLQSQAQMIVRMDENLQRLGSTISPDLQRTLSDLQSRLREGEGLALSYRQTESTYSQLFPKELSAALSSDDVLRNGRRRWDEEYASLQRAATLQGQIVDGIGTDTGLLDTALARSRNASGALDVAQAGNELSALNVKQSLQLQGLLAAQSRAETMSRARDLATEDEARQRFKGFVGTGSGYSRSQ
jgi:P-type conjugative transfer protein TrbJ